MRKVILYVLLVAILSLGLVLAVSASKAEPPTANGLSFSTAILPAHPAVVERSPVNPSALVNDGSFENGPPPASAWTETTNSTCEWIGDWSGVWGAAAFDGSMDFWAGGYCGGVPATSSVSQASIAVPAADNMLHFHYMAYRPDPDDPTPDDYAYLKVNGTTVWTLDLTQANNTYPNWVEATYSLAAYASTNVTLEFAGVSTGASTGNIRYDYILIGEPPPPPLRCDAGYHEVTVMTEGFEGAFPPAGWAVANNGGSCTNASASPVWTNVDGGGRGNLSGGTGAFAMADSDYCGSGSFMDTEMWTPNVDLTGLTAPHVAFNLDYYALGDYANVDASTDGGATWTNVKSWTASARGPRLYDTVIPGDGQNDVKVRWHYGNANWAWWWEVDSVAVTACEPDQPTAINLTGVTANPAAPLAALPWAIPTAIAAVAGLAWVARKRTH